MRECSATSVRAQYAGGAVGGSTVPPYRDEPRVDPASTTETYAAFRIAVDNWRWAGVPFYLRTGKRLAKKKSEVVIQFKQPPLALFRQASMAAPEPNLLVISIQPEETIKLRFAAKVPGPDVTTSPVDMRFNYDDYFGVEHHTGYETLLYDAMTGDRSLFKRADIVEAGWAVVDPILKAWAQRRMRAGAVTPPAATGLGEADDTARARGAAVATAVIARSTVHGRTVSCVRERPYCVDRRAVGRRPWTVDLMIPCALQTVHAWPTASGWRSRPGRAS